MSLPALRPRFELVVPAAPEEVIATFNEQLESSVHRFHGGVLGNCAELSIRSDQLRYWSPQLSFQAEPHEEGSVIYGRVGPQPHVWTMFVASYAIGGFSAIFALVFAWSQWHLNQPLWALWVVAVGAIVIGAAYATARFGQHLASHETHELMGFLERMLEAPPLSTGRPQLS